MINSFPPINILFLTHYFHKVVHKKECYFKFVDVCICNTIGGLYILHFTAMWIKVSGQQLICYLMILPSKRIVFIVKVNTNLIREDVSVLYLIFVFPFLFVYLFHFTLLIFLVTSSLCFSFCIGQLDCINYIHYDFHLPCRIGYNFYFIIICWCSIVMYYYMQFVFICLKNVWFSLGYEADF